VESWSNIMACFKEYAWIYIHSLWFLFITRLVSVSYNGVVQIWHQRRLIKEWLILTIMLLKNWSHGAKQATITSSIYSSVYIVNHKLKMWRVDQISWHVLKSTHGYIFIRCDFFSLQDVKNYNSKYRKLDHWWIFSY
jgi:hypothetical protein